MSARRAPNKNVHAPVSVCHRRCTGANTPGARTSRSVRMTECVPSLAYEYKQKTSRSSPRRTSCQVGAPIEAGFRSSLALLAARVALDGMVHILGLPLRFLRHVVVDPL